jgi:dTDP-glucose 4,6-dehydratase
MQILVTGGCGFIASNFINRMKDKYPQAHFVNVDKLDYCSNVHNVEEGKCTFIKGDITNIELINHVISEYKFDTVFHFAAQSHVDNSFGEPLKYTIDNVYGTHVLLEMCKKHIPNVEFIHFSTDEVYGESKDDVAFTEEKSLLKPTNPYSASKAAAEMIVNSYLESFNMNIKIIRCNNVYGPKQYPEKLIPKFIKLLNNDQKCTIHGKNAENVKRAFIHVDDVTDAVEAVWKRGKTGEIYNIASNVELSVMEVARIIIKTVKNTTDYDSWLTYIDDRPFNDVRYHICADKLASIGWSQKRGMDNFIEFIRNSSLL